MQEVPGFAIDVDRGPRGPVAVRDAGRSEPRIIAQRTVLRKRDSAANTADLSSQPASARMGVSSKT
jgi:hypothetical protein